MYGASGSGDVPTRQHLSLAVAAPANPLLKYGSLGWDMTGLHPTVMPNRLHIHAVDDAGQRRTDRLDDDRLDAVSNGIVN